ncbi:MAG: extracellular solute-binding protein [Patescibacteria group bacterium]
MKQNPAKKLFKIANLFLIFAFLLTAGFGCKNPNQQVQEYLKPITLNYWRVWDDNDAFDEIIADYQKLHPNIKINYRKFRAEEYEQELVNAFAEDRGPDIFSINEGWRKKYQAKIVPMPPQITLAYQKERGTIKKEVVSELLTKPSPTLRQLKENFADVVYKNAVIDGRVYGLPLSLETLIMYYNKDILNKAGVTEPPNNWTNFQEAVQKITRFDDKGKIIQSGAALGAADNIDNVADILSILIMQNGAEMADANGYATFLSNNKDGYNPGVEAIKFYLDFASPVKNVYNWNSEMPNSLEAFLAGRVAFVFSYNYYLPIIKSRAPKLNLGLAPIPQVNPDAPVNYANYWLETVSKKSTHQNEAWDFILFATGKPEVEKFLSKTQRPTALKSLINGQLEVEALHASAAQILTAQNWYQGRDLPAMEKIIKDMISQLLKSTNDREFENILRNSILKVNQTI